MAKKTQVKKSDTKTRIAVFAVLAVIILAIAVIVGLAVASGGNKEEDESGLLTEVLERKGTSRVIGQEEYDFYRRLVERDTYGDRTDEEFDEMTREYINEVNAKFLIGNIWGLCQPYDYSVLNYNMEQENLSRQVKIANGEPVYGPESFTLTTYFEYVYSNLETDIQNYIIDNADDDMIQKAREYYEADKMNFEMLASVTYEITENGNTETETVDSAGLRSIANADDSLYSFLVGGEEGQILDDEYYGSKRHIRLIEQVYVTPEFDEAYTSAMMYYISNEIIDELYETVARNNPVIFDLD